MIAVNLSHPSFPHVSFRTLGNLAYNYENTHAIIAAVRTPPPSSPPSLYVYDVYVCRRYVCTNVGVCVVCVYACMCKSICTNVCVSMYKFVCRRAVFKGSWQV